jgi:hypothetical protein
MYGPRGDGNWFVDPDQQLIAMRDPDFDHRMWTGTPGVTVARPMFSILEDHGDGGCYLCEGAVLTSSLEVIE